MRRISLALALLGAVTAACSSGAKNSDSGSDKGVTNGTFTVTVQNGQNGNTGLAITGGYVTSVPAGIDCGVAPHAACVATFPASATVVLTATATGTDAAFNLPYQFLGWAGDCQGESTCSLSGNADKYVVTMFAGQRTGHPNWTDGAVHGPKYQDYVNAVAGALDCRSCHGANLQGQGIAPSCSSCHPFSSTPATPAKTGLKVQVTAVTLDSTAKTVAVSFSLKDNANNPVDLKGVYSRNLSMDGTVRLALARIDLAADSKVLPYAVLTPATGSPGTITMPLVGAAAGTTGQLVEVGTNAGTYTYTSPTLAKIDATKLSNTHTIWIQATRQENLTNAFDPKSFTAVNYQYNFDTSTGAAVAAKREVASTAGCSKCHDGFPAEPKADNTGWASFHSGARIDAAFCDVCHNPGRTSNPAADAMVFVHRIHAAEQVELPVALEFHGIAVTYPQDVRNCSECHGGAAQGDQYKTRPTRAACGSCHYDVDFSTGAGHSGGIMFDDTSCTTCHGSASIDSAHTPVIAKDPANIIDTPTGGNSRTNAGAIAAVGALPAGADRITYEVGTVSAVADAGGKLRPTITFKFKKNGADVVFNTAPATASVSAELMDGFTGTTSAYFAFAVPQDGIAAPADFNVSASGNIKQIWLGKSSGTSAGTLVGPDASGFYTLTLTGVAVPTNAVRLTGGIGYTYDLPNTQPLTQTNLAAYPTTDVNITTGTVVGVTCSSTTPCVVKTGGLIVPVQNVWKTATGFTARRTIVANAKCNACHGFLGVAPNFHVGQRNDAPTCSFCHTPNRTSSGWSANAATFIHGIHGAGKRTVPFNWHAGSCPTGSTFTATAGTSSGTCVVDGSSPVATVLPSPWYPEIEYPGSSCTQCHVDGSYDFSDPAAAAAVPNMLWSTVATGTFSAAISNSPYVTLGTAYGSGFSYNAGTGVTTAAAGTTLVSSPLAAACFSCHDSATAQTHMEKNLGVIYKPRSAAAGLMIDGQGEPCLDCHGPGKMAPIGEVH